MESFIFQDFRVLAGFSDFWLADRISRLAGLAGRAGRGSDLGCQMGASPADLAAKQGSSPADLGAKQGSSGVNSGSWPRVEKSKKK